MIPGLSAAVLWVAVAQEPPLMADTTRTPRVTVSWETADGKAVTVQGDRGYKSVADKSLLGKNIDCYVAMGGTRHEKGLGDSRGAVVRVGLEKVDPKALMFEGIKEGSVVTVTLEGVRMTRPVEPRSKSVLLRSKYKLSDLASCGIDSTGRSLYCTADPDDPLKPLVKPENGRFGSLDGKEGHGSAETKVEADGSVTLTVKFPYALLKHVKDPNLRTKPGAFFEPETMHVEMEMVEKADASRPPE